MNLTTDDGVEGIGEAWGPPSITKAYLDLIAPYFIGREVYGFEHATNAIRDAGLRASNVEWRRRGCCVVCSKTSIAKAPARTEVGAQIYNQAINT